MKISGSLLLGSPSAARCRPDSSWLFGLVVLVSAFLAACGGGGQSGVQPSPGGVTVEAPTGLAYSTAAPVYEYGQAIPANKPSASGGAIDRFEVAPQLPAGLALNPTSGVISGTPTAIAASSAYVVTASNAGGAATTRLQIEVRATPTAPVGLTYREPNTTYFLGQAITANTPTSSGGAVLAYTVTPALPAGLTLDSQTGAITGTPSALTPAASYVITATNAVGSVSFTLLLSVEPLQIAPSSVVYDTVKALYVAGEAIVTNNAQVTGGTTSTFSVSPALPSGLSINAQTGVISGTPGAIQSEQTYTVRAGNAAGSAQVLIKISITARGSWIASSVMPESKYAHAAVTLKDGRVLAMGGYFANAFNSESNTAFLYDPSLDSWSAATPMNRKRAELAAVTLQDGRVLAIGGEGAATAELYDPATDTWTLTGPMSRTRSSMTATLLPDGKVLVIGGWDDNPVDVVELFDPATNSWTTRPDRLAVGRTQHTAQLLPGGNFILVAGGLDMGPGLLSTTAEIYPVSGGAPEVIPSPIKANFGLSAQLADGSILVLDDQNQNSARFNPVTKSWSLIDMGSRAFRETLTALADGRVLRTGGATTATAVVYNPDADQWTAAAVPPITVYSSAAARLPDGSVLMTGGVSGGVAVATTYRYVP